MTRRGFLQSALAARVVAGGWRAGPAGVFAMQAGRGGARVTPANNTLTLARFLNRARYDDLPRQAVEHAKMIIASTLASAAPGSLIGSARILRDLAKADGGTPEASIWFDGTRLPAPAAARVNAALSDAAVAVETGGAVGRRVV